MILKKFGHSKFVQMYFKNVTKVNDEFACSVHGRLQTYNDLIAEEAVYQRTCYQKFLSNEGESNPVGMLFNDKSNNTFNKLCLWLESEAGTDLLTVDELQEKWKGFSNHLKHIQSSEYRPVNS